MSIDETVTISSPIVHLDDLLSLNESSVKHRFFTSPLIQRLTTPKEKILLCHDMKGGYLEDKHTQGSETNDQCYRFFRWHLIDTFVYFAHQLVTIPPLVWIDVAHRNGVQILGTFITEFNEGKMICDRLFESDEFVDRIVDALAFLMKSFQFDGYLLNIENPIEAEQMPRLLRFVTKMKSVCSQIDTNSLIIWYDSVTINGELKWQNQLNQLNESFFNECDGIFLNYTWKPEYLLQSKINAGKRDRDVFVGVDVFGRGCFGGGGFNTCEAMAIGHQLGLSIALFAPGWLFETLNAEEFVENDRKFWNLLEPFANNRVLQTNMLTTSFSDGFGDEFFIHGQSVAHHRWYHLALQSYFPNTSSENQWTVDHRDAYFAGSSIVLEGEPNGFFHLFKCAIAFEFNMEIVIVMKTNVSVNFELKCDDGSTIHLDKCDEETIIRHWQRKTYRIQTDQRRSITDIYIAYQRTAETNIRLGFFSIRPVVKFSPTVCSLVKSMEKNSNESFILHFIDTIERNSSTMVFIFARDQFERYRFLGATRQSYFLIYSSDLTNKSEEESSILVIRHYSLETLRLLNEEILSIPMHFDCLKGFCSKKIS